MDKIINRLKKNIDSFNIDQLDEDIVVLREYNNINEYKNIIMDTLFSILESNPDEDFGMPGQIVHFLESFYKNGYEEKLLESLQRKPTSHTVWMLNRVINGSEGELLIKYNNFMNQLLKREDIDDALRLEISDFLND